MTTITVDGDCLKNVDKLQSLLKLRFDSFSGENITRGAAVNWAVNQQISTMTAPINVVGGTTNQSFPVGSPFTVNSTNFAEQPIMVAYISPTPTSSISTVPTTKTKSHKGGGKVASSMGND